MHALAAPLRLRQLTAPPTAAALRDNLESPHTWWRRRRRRDGSGAEKALGWPLHWRD